MVDHGLTMVSWWSDHGQSWSVTMVNHGQMMVDHGLTANMSQGSLLHRIKPNKLKVVDIPSVKLTKKRDRVVPWADVGTS